MMTILKNASLSFVLSGGILATCGGCSSVMTHSGGEQGYYSGTKSSMTTFKDEDTSWAMMPMVALDVPFSAMLDTLLLPYDYYRIHSDHHSTSARDRLEEYERRKPAGDPPRPAMIPVSTNNAGQ
ncbi:YceK/YidQ family lipoprotein [Dickeya dianthicola]|uniref:YceK/YidQ family lipoprotein n=1 Tax=Dickeya dianthicola TaxID=204039 RepID=A0AAP2GFR0_9GAMM|nr:YceK/YidQ family lipoprotein [Dickeya dianthicola]MBI0440301.1 YceK/YidQ family lipoprotein [Dickeya dianthicola]MBI0451327.1 YceK/YidQ family lipoprotein [Dickeya dianthicola]MBI0455751.1 YceK/YidQ family lipoprotein [Dickeya dianthicola]MBI0459052.1 YceK/YidQ family lipoprotein [Dickeya dianthicola]MBI0463136.1 YceK/YidQ family lipoprotein [Dickeya dianthicola]